MMIIVFSNKIGFDILQTEHCEYPIGHFWWCSFYFYKYRIRSFWMPYSIFSDMFFFIFDVNGTHACGQVTIKNNKKCRLNSTIREDNWRGRQTVNPASSMPCLPIRFDRHLHESQEHEGHGLSTYHLHVWESPQAAITLQRRQRYWKNYIQWNTQTMIII